MSENKIDEEIQKLEQELEQLQSAPQDLPVPETPESDSNLKFFREIIKSTDSKKTANLTSDELGSSKTSVRGLHLVSLYAKAEGLNKVSDYLTSKAEIVQATSVSRKGFLLQTVVTQIKKTLSLGSPASDKKKSWFNFGNKNKQVEQTMQTMDGND